MAPSAVSRSCAHSLCPTLLPEALVLNTNAFVIDHLCPVLDRFKIGIGVIDMRLNYRAVNHALAGMNGVPAEAHRGKPLHEVVGALATKIGMAVEQVFRTGQPLPGFQISGELPKRPGSGHWVGHYLPRVDQRGRVVEVGVFVAELNPGTAQQGWAESILSERERQVLRLLAIGKCTKEISAMLGIGAKTVESHRARVMLKIQAPSLVHLARFALRHGIVDLQE